MQTVSIVVPVKEEQDTVRELIVQIEAAFEHIDAAEASLKEVIFIDDGSQDNTWKEISGSR